MFKCVFKFKHWILTRLPQNSIAISILLRLMQKARSLVSELTAVEEKMMSQYTQGVVGGFKKESGTELY